MIFLAATVFGLGKTFFWPTMLGVVAERFPKGGALTINTISGVGMLSVGIIGAVLIGNIQDTQINNKLNKEKPAIYQEVIGMEKVSVFGKYNAIDPKKIEALSAEKQSEVESITAQAKKNALMWVAIFPAIMLICYLILIFYFRAKGGYKPVELSAQEE